MYLYTRTCMFVCASVHTGLHACMCARAGMRACTCARMRGCVHAHMLKQRVCVCRLCSCIISALETFEGLACMPCSYSNSGAAGAAAYEPLAVESLAAVVRDSLPRGTRLLNNTKAIV